MILRHHAGRRNAPNDRPDEIRVRRNLSGRGRAELEATPGEVPRGGLEVMRSHALAIAGRAVADGAVVTEHARARSIGLSRGRHGEPEPESRGEQADRP